MIKKIVLIILFITLIILAFMQNSFFKKNAQSFVSRLEQIENYIDEDDYISANEIYISTFNIWKDKKGKYEHLCEHEEVDNIHTHFEMLGVLIEDNDKLSKTQIAVLMYLFEHIVDIDSFSFENIF